MSENLYCKILDENTGEVQLGAGCDDEYYIEIGMEKRDVERSEVDDKWYLSEKCPHYTPEQAAQIEQEMINDLTMTPLDFIGVLMNFGLTLAQINAFLESNLEIKTQLTYCNNVYCGVVKQFLPMTVEGVEITERMVEVAFKLKNGVL